MSTTDTTAGTVPDVLAFLAGVDRGRFVTEAGSRLQELVAAIEETGRGGTLTITLGVKPTGKSTPGQVGSVLVTPEVKVRAPKPARAESLFFVTDDHDLSRRDPSPSLFDRH